MSVFWIFLTCRYDYGVNKSKFLSNADIEDLEKKGISLKRKSLEEVYDEHMVKEPPADDYEIVRGPRPWEDHPQKDRMLANKKIPTAPRSLGL